MYVLGDRYLRAGRSVDAEEVFGKLVNREPESAQAWLGYGRALVERDPDRAQHAGLEAYSLAPGVEPVRLVAEAALNAGRTQQARDSVQAFLELRPDARPELQDLLERMP
jgi:cytochrome c-type biogenesis protein CcmH/NrfG